MPIERYTVGRSYTKRPRARADDPAAILTLMEEFAAAGPYTVARRLEGAEEGSRAYLEQAGMPLNPNGPPYVDPSWLRENERTSPVWYAINILNTIRMLRKQMERGDVRAAVDFALDLGVLTTEAKIVQERVGKQGAAGRVPREESAQRHAEWRGTASKVWADHPKWSATRVAGKIARDVCAAGGKLSHETVRPVIRDLNPTKRQKSQVKK